MPEHGPKEDQKTGEELSGLAQGMQSAQPWIGAVWKLLGGCLVGVLGGIWLDRTLGWTPWGLVGFSVLGITVGFYGFIKAALSLGKKK